MGRELTIERYCKIFLQTDEDTAIRRMNNLRGLFAIMIVIGHCSMQFEQELFPLMLIHKFNMVSVCFFFVISGWSLAYNVNRNKNYLMGFCWNKAFKLFLFSLVCEIVARIMNYLLFETKIKLFDIGIITGFNWYVYEIIIYYLIFYFGYKMKCKKTARMIFFIICSFVVSVFTWYMSNNYTTFWTHAFHFSSMCFTYGIILHEYNDRLVKLFRRKIFISILLLVCGLASCICIKMPQGSFLGGVILHNLVGICIMSLIALWAYYIDYQKIPIVGWLTKYATEIYLYQFMMLSVFVRLYKNWKHDIDLSYVCLVVACTLGMAMIMHYVNKQISKGISFLVYGLYVKKDNNVASE